MKKIEVDIAGRVKAEDLAEMCNLFLKNQVKGEDKMSFEEGDLVEGKLTGVIVKVTEVNLDKNYFNGIIIKSGNSSYSTGRYSKFFDIDSFKKKVKEDKMGEVRVVRKLEDLDGLENGYGAKIYLTTSGELRVSVGGIKWLDPNVGGLEIEEVLKKLGFKFEYKPKRIVYEVIKEIKSMESLPFKQGEVNYFVSSHRGKYFVEAMRETFIIGVNYMTKEQAEAYVDELNEIIGVGK